MTTRERGSILLYRLGSLGDTIVSLPALRLVAEAFPDDDRILLTNFSEDRKAAPLSEVLANTGLVHDYVRYPPRLRDPLAFMELRREIRRFRPHTVIYMAAPRGRLKALRDGAFFRWCGIRRLVGIPLVHDLQRVRRLADGRFEYEGARLLRCLQRIGHIDLDSDEAFDLKLTEREQSEADAALDHLGVEGCILAASIGAKVDVKDWGDEKWSALLSRLDDLLDGWSLVMLGAASERDRTERLLRSWGGAKLNLCGELSVRGSAAALQRARVFVGHDSGPMHLAAAVGTPCVAIFSSRNLPGQWFPWGTHHRVLYTDVPCRGCNLNVCVRYEKMCIASILVDDVVREVQGALGNG